MEENDHCDEGCIFSEVHKLLLGLIGPSLWPSGISTHLGTGCDL